MKKIINFNLIALGILTSLSTVAADGELDSYSSEGSSIVSLRVAPEIKISGIEDMNFSNVTQSDISETYEETIEMSFCVYTNSQQFGLSFNFDGTGDLNNGEVIFPDIPFIATDGGGLVGGDDIIIEDDSALYPSNSIPVKYELYRNEIFNGAITESVLVLESIERNTEVYGQDTLVEIMNEDCTSFVSNEQLENYTIKATVSGFDLLSAAGGDYSESIYITAIYGGSPPV